MLGGGGGGSHRRRRLGEGTARTGKAPRPAPDAARDEACASRPPTQKRRSVRSGTWTFRRKEAAGGGGGQRKRPRGAVAPAATVTHRCRVPRRGRRRAGAHPPAALVHFFGSIPRHNVCKGAMARDDIRSGHASGSRHGSGTRPTVTSAGRRQWPRFVGWPPTARGLRRCCRWTRRLQRDPAPSRTHCATHGGCEPPGTTLLGAKNCIWGIAQ